MKTTIRTGVLRVVEASKKRGAGTVGIELDRGRLRLRLPRSLYGGNQKYLALKLEDTPENRAIAEAKAAQIQKDIALENFDQTLERYKPKSLQAVGDNVVPFERVKLGELWDSYIEGRKAKCESSTMRSFIKGYSAYIEKLPTHDLRRAQEIKEWIEKSGIIPRESGRRFLEKIQACCREAVIAGKIKENPFEGMKIEKPKNGAKKDIDPFTIEERDRILEAFRINSIGSKFARVKHSHYYNYVFFKFFTGCRCSEAVGLQWKHISEDFNGVRFEQAGTKTLAGIQFKDGSKNDKTRSFPCNARMREFLQSIKPENAKPDDLVFPSPTGGFIDNDNFRNRAWKTVLKGLGIRYRKPYQTRHTFITACLKSHPPTPVQVVAKWVDNSPEIIYKHYAGNLSSILPPDS